MKIDRNEAPRATSYLLVLDGDAHRFSIVDPGGDAHYLHGRAAKEQSKGRKLTLRVAPGNDAVTISKLVKSTGFDYTVEPLL
jgi:hypothetical protein